MASAPVSVEFIHGARVQKLGMGSGDQDPSKLSLTSSFIVNTIFWPPCNFKSGQSSCMLFWMFFMFSSKMQLFQNFRFKLIYATPAGYTKMIDSKFKIPNKFRRGAHRGWPSPLLRPLPRSFSGFAFDSGFARFRPPTFDAWLCPYHTWGRDLQMWMFNIRWMNTPKLCV